MLVSLGLVVTWARTPALAVAALLAAVLGAITCVLVSRTATSAFASSLSSRRFRDLAAILLAVLGAGFAVGANLLSRVALEHSRDPAALLATTAAVVSWSPFGWAWALPGDVARGAWGVAALHLALAAGLVAGLWACWRYFLDRRLVEPTSGGSGSAPVSANGWIERLYPAGAAGAVATRSLRYWRRDPRHLAALASALVTPLALVVVVGVVPGGVTRLAVFVPAALALLVGTSVAQDLPFDGSALWLHLSAGVPGADDRRGRVLAALTVFGPLLLVLHLVLAAVSGAWSDLPAALGLSAALTLGGMGVGSWVGAVWQWPGPVPGESPFQRGSSGGLPALASGLAVLTGTALVGLPALVLLFGGVLWRPWLGWLALPVGLLTGLVVLRVGMRMGGRLLDRRWPEVLRAVSEQAA